MQNHIWHVFRKQRGTYYSAVVIAPNLKAALMCIAGVSESAYLVTNIGTANKMAKLGVVVADFGPEEDEEYELTDFGRGLVRREQGGVCNVETD